MDNGHWSDRYTKAELVKLVTEIGTRRNPTLMKDAAYVLEGGSVAVTIGAIADEVADFAMVIAKRHGAYEDAASLGDVADCLREIEEEYAAHMGLPLPRPYTEEDSATCEHGHINCAPGTNGGKCGDECD